MNSKSSQATLRSDNVPISRTFTRSPQPYHRRGRSLLTVESDEDRNLPSSAASSTGRVSPILGLSSESGTEADDEGGQSLKRLPAPPLKPSKGLRGSRLDHSPLPTPARKLEHPAFPSTSELARDVNDSETEEDIERRVAQEQYTKRWRGEIVRRLTEAVLFLVIGVIVCQQKEVRRVLGDWRQESTAIFSIPVFLYLLYPLRLLYRARWPQPDLLQVPAKFDPAPLLYPPFLPFMVAASLAPNSSNFILPNMILGLASLPPSCIPEYESTFYFSHVQWLLSALPLALSQHALTKNVPAKPLALKSSIGDMIHPEAMILLYPCQQSLVPILKYLTTTSLDHSELQLLSTTMLNLLLLAQSPQMEILKSMLWIGGLGLLCVCSKVLEWEVALARLPFWRLRRNERRKKSKRPLLNALDADLCGRIVRFTDPMQHDWSSDDMMEPSGPKPRRLPGGSRPPLTLSVDERSSSANKATIQEPASAVENRSTAVNGENIAMFSTRNRRHTMTTMADALKNLNPKSTLKGRQKKFIAPALQPFLAFTPAQALVRKWLYAAYAYMSTVLLIMIPIRRYISVHALQGCDPFGWAIGYLAGNSPDLRFWTVTSNLDHWIMLPSLAEHDIGTPAEDGLVDHFRRQLGEANTRLVLCGYCVCVLTVGIISVLHLTSIVEVDTRRKVFHGIMVAMLLPSIYVDPCFIALALGLVLAIFLLLDLFRAAQLPPISRPLTYFLAPYVDGRDHRGPVIVSHIFLLIGCAIPFWLSMAGVQRTGDGPWKGWELDFRDTSMVSGVICVGLGDAAASLIGRRFGRHKWYWAGGKSLEGSMAFVLAVTSGLLAAHTWLVIGGWRHHEQSWLAVVTKSMIAASGASLTEAVLTGANDNVVVPVILWLLVRGLRI